MTTPLRIIFMGTPDFSVPALEALIAADKKIPPFTGGHRGEATEKEISSPPSPPHLATPSAEAEGFAKASAVGLKSLYWQIVAVYTQPPRPKGRGQQVQKSPVHELAEAHHIPVYTPTSLKTAEVQAEFAALNADVAVVVAYGLLLPQAILDAPKHGCINIHPSALPRWRGAAPIQRTIMAGDSQTEICIMKMDSGLDTGDVYLRSALITIPPDMNAGALHDKLAHDAAPLLLQTLADIANGTAKATPQSGDGVTYAQKITKIDARIDWSKSAAEIHNHIRGLSPFPGATTILHGEVLKAYHAIIPSPLRVEGTVAGITIDDHLTILCGDGQLLRLTEVQLPGKPRMSAEAFLRGHPVAKGDRLG